MSEQYLFSSINEEGRNAVFSDAGDPSNYSAYLPVIGSDIDFGSSYGAQEFLLGLLDNGSDEPNENPIPDTSMPPILE